MDNIFIFYILFFFIIFNAIMIIINTNPIHSVLFLVLVFVCVTILLLLIGVEFLAMIFLVIYIGAITVLFLFVIMMLNVKIIEFNEKFINYLPIGFFIGLIFIFEMFFFIYDNIVTWNLSITENYLTNINKLLFENYFISLNNYFTIISISNVEQVAIALYNKFVYFFFLSGIILLVAMLGAIVLTLNQKFKNKKQEIYTQTIRSLEDSIRYLNYKK